MPGANTPGILNTANPANLQHSLNAGRLGWWMGPPHNSGGIFLYDLMGRWPGTLSGTTVPAWTSRNPRPGAVGPSLSLDGSTSYVSTTFTPTLQAATFSAWIYSNATQGAFTGILTGRTSTATGLMANSGSLCYDWNDAAGTYSFASGLSIPNGRWIFAALVTTAADATLYLGDNNRLTSANNAIANASVTLGPINIGRDNVVHNFNGQIDDASIWSRPLSAGEVWSLYQEGLTGYPNMLGWLEPWMLGVPAASTPATLFRRRNRVGSRSLAQPGGGH